MASARPSVVDVGLLVVRVGIGLALGLLFVWGGFPNAGVTGVTGHAWAVGALVILGMLAVLGLATRVTGGLLAAAMAWAAVAGLGRGQQPFEEPVRAVMFAVLSAAVAMTGAGALALDSLVEPYTAGWTSRRRVQQRWPDIGRLVLRLGTGLSLFCFFGLTKIGWIVALIHSPDPLDSWGFAQLIRTVGFPAPVILAFCVVLNETVTPLLVASGLLTRAASIVGALGMAGAMVTSLRIAEEPVRAVLYVIAFAALAFTGPGKYSLDRVFASRRHARSNSGR